MTCIVVFFWGEIICLQGDMTYSEGNVTYLQGDVTPEAVLAQAAADAIDHHCAQLLLLLPRHLPPHICERHTLSQTLFFRS